MRTSVPLSCVARIPKCSPSTEVIMQVGSFSHQVALAVPMGPYNDFSERITSVQPARVVDDEVGYLILVARNQNDGQRSWEVLLAGSRDQVLQPGLLLNGGADVL